MQGFSVSHLSGIGGLKGGMLQVLVQGEAGKASDTGVTSPSLLPLELYSKLLKGGYIGDYIKDYYRVIKGGYQEF